VLDNENLSNAINPVLKDRRELITETIHLREREQRSFWPVYEKYEEEMLVIITDTATLMNQLSALPETLSEEQIDTLIDQLLATQNKSTELQKQYAKNFRAILPPKKLASFVGILFLL
jgi:spore coat polysaccharide biosynthesis protein SpsF (cytidylyltransferase family)